MAVCGLNHTSMGSSCLKPRMFHHGCNISFVDLYLDLLEQVIYARPPGTLGSNNCKSYPEFICYVYNPYLHLDGPRG